MAVYKIFPNKDATLYSRYAYRNAGRDAILEVSAKNSLDYLRSNIGQIEKSPYFNYDFSYIANNALLNNAPNEDIRRAIISFSDTDIAYVKTLNSSSFRADLRLYLAFAQNLSLNYTLNCYPLSQSWDMGTGTFNDWPETENGVGWQYSGQAGTTAAWNSAYGTMNYLFVTGGGTWNSNISSSQSFQYTSPKDVYMNITSMVSQWFSGSINYGLIVKHTSSIEMMTSSYIDLKFFSMDTHTIYPPCIDFKWDDSSFVTSSAIPFLLDSNFIIACENNRSTYKENAIYNFRFKAKDKYPVRQFSTSSIYLNWKYLSSSSYWAIQDYKTKEYIVDFDSSYTKLSADTNGNYFKVYMNGLQPERYYKIVIKTILPSLEEVLVDNDIIFKVIR
jgi:hypothetical protein